MSERVWNPNVRDLHEYIEKLERENVALLTRLREAEGISEERLDALQATAKNAIAAEDKLAQAEQRVAGLEATLREWLAQPHEVGDEQIRAALTPPPPAKEYLRTTLHGVKVKVLLDDEQK